MKRAPLPLSSTEGAVLWLERFTLTFKNRLLQGTEVTRNRPFHEQIRFTIDDKFSISKILEVATVIL